MSQVLRTEATDEKIGFMRVVVSASDDRILGFAMIGSEAGEVLAVVQTAMMRAYASEPLREHHRGAPRSGLSRTQRG
jgi:pyruvate/2-oxoglutarate dehydrogenase complex dihydrolipoamide dehydrogenase (E3) component